MAAAKNNTCSFPRQSSYNSLYANPLSELKHNRSCSEGDNSGGGNVVPLAVHIRRGHVNVVHDDKENVTPNVVSQSGNLDDAKENAVSGKGIRLDPKDFAITVNNGYHAKDRALKPSSLQLCIQRFEPDSTIGTKFWEPVDSEKNNSGNIWDYSDSESAPASSWSTLPNRSLLFRPLPVDIGRCTCLIVKEASPKGLERGTLYSLYTNEGQGRQNRKLAVALHLRCNGRSKFIVASNVKGILGSNQDESLIGHMTGSIMGSKYRIWGQGNHRNSMSKLLKLLAVVSFVPTIATWTGSHRNIKAWIPKHQSMQLKNTNQHINGLPLDWKEKKDKTHQLFSRVPYYNKMSRQYELDFRDRGRTGLRIQTSVKNFQLTLEKNGRQTILQLGRVGNANYVMDFRYPMTGFQAFCICLASIDSKPCCTM